MTDAELIARLRNWPYQGETMAGEAADRIEALLVGHELQEVIDKQAALLADAYGADLDWEEVLKQRADHEAVKRIEALIAERDYTEGTNDTLIAINQALTAKLAKAEEALDMLVRDCEADYPPSHGAIKHFAIATLAEIKGESHE